MKQNDQAALLIRQINDLCVQAERLTRGRPSSEELENFARFSEELKEYILSNVEQDDVRILVAEIPVIKYSRMEIKLWYYLIWAVWIVQFAKDYVARNRTLAEVAEVRNKYTKLEFIIREHLI